MIIMVKKVQDMTYQAKILGIMRTVSEFSLHIMGFSQKWVFYVCFVDNRPATTVRLKCWLCLLLQ